MEILISILLFVVPLFVLGFIIGRTVEKKHFQNLEQREAAISDMLVTQLKSFPNAAAASPPPALMLAEAVIASDYLKAFFGKWRNVFGGEIKSYQTLQERGKREVVLRLAEKARAQGYNAICNVRISPADVGGNTTASKKQKPMAAVIATATAYVANPQ